MDLYIESLEGGTYLAAVGQDNHRSYLRNDTHKVRSFHSLTEVKDHVSGQQFDHVYLTHQSTYDEMVGLDTNGDTSQIELEW